MTKMSDKEYVLSQVYDAHHSLGQYAYIRGFEDCSDELWIQRKKGERWECLVSNAGCESDAWAWAASRLRHGYVD